MAILCFGLRENSRIKKNLSNTDYDFDTYLLAGMLDKLAFLAWSKTVDAEKGRNAPKSILSSILNVEKDNDLMTYESAEDFEKARREILERQ